MKKHLKAFFIFLLPFLKIALKDVTVSAVTKFAYPDETPTRRPLYYGRRPPPGTINYARMQRGMSRLDDQWRNVLTVAFDISGPNEAVVQEFLSNMMPASKYYSSHDCVINSWEIESDKKEEN